MSLQSADSAVRSPRPLGRDHLPRAIAQPTRSRTITWLALMTAALVGVGVAISPIATTLALAVAGALWLLSFGRRMVPVFHGSLLVILVGYAFLGKGFAYVGTSPVYVGELVMGLGVIATLVSLPMARWHPVHLVIVAFMIWGAARTIPYISTYGVDAPRDGVAYIYGLFAIAVSVTLRKEQVVKLIGIYRRLIPWFVVWVPIAAILYTTLGPTLPSLWPGSGVPVIVFKAGDAGVHLGAVGAFMVLGLGGSESSRLKDSLIWAAWLVAVGIMGSISRGGLVAASMMAASVLFIRTTIHWITLVMVAVALIAIVGLVDPQVDIGTARKLSFDQVVANVTSVFTGENDISLEGTKEWRLQWWNKIIGYTIDGPYFWTGKGFGINLADDDGFQVNADGSLRAPHNGHLELLARGGVPMLALWILLQIAVGLTLFRAALRARSAGLTWWLRVTGWIVVYWLATLVNAAFDVYLQGPMGGVLYWSVVGAAIAVAGMIEREAAGSTPEA